jgi:hypothetical protein
MQTRGNLELPYRHLKILPSLTLNVAVLRSGSPGCLVVGRRDHQSDGFVANKLLTAMFALIV